MDSTASKTKLSSIPKSVSDITFQETSLDIWDSKYCLKTKQGESVDVDMDGTYQRVARSLAAVEAKDKRKPWEEKFLWALRHGVIPAGRIISNAGAQEHKPATSTINCTVSGIILDSMEDILHKNVEAGLTLKAGCG
ncbi:MAG: ribonucleoside-diphosphate reductase alpha chain, partial [Sulfitobacter sp.]